MQRTVNLVDGLLAMGRNLEKQGQFSQACRVLERLEGMRELPDRVARKTQSRLGRLQFQSGQYASARRHLLAVLAHRPDHAPTHYLLALAILEDEECDPEQATEHFRRCLQQEPYNPEYLVAFGRHALDRGMRPEGLKMLRRAFELAGDDLEIIEQVIEGMHEAGEFEEAEIKLRITGFRHGRNQHFRQIYQHHQFQVVRAQQQEIREPSSPEPEAPIILPFVKLPRVRKINFQAERILGVGRKAVGG